MQLYAVHHVLSEDEFRFEESIEARLRVLIDARIHALETEEKALVASNP